MPLRNTWIEAARVSSQAVTIEIMQVKLAESPFLREGSSHRECNIKFQRETRISGDIL